MSDDIERACRECWLGIANQTDEHAISTLTALVREQVEKHGKPNATESHVIDVAAGLCEMLRCDQHFLEQVVKEKIARIAELEAALEKAEGLQKALDERLPTRTDRSESAGAVIRARSELRGAIEAARTKVKP